MSADAQVSFTTMRRLGSSRPWYFHCARRQTTRGPILLGGEQGSFEATARRLSVAARPAD